MSESRLADLASKALFRSRALALAAVAVGAAFLAACTGNVPSTPPVTAIPPPPPLNATPPAPAPAPEKPLALAPKPKDALRIHVIDVDDGSCVLIECPESSTSGPHALLNDCGSSQPDAVGGRVAAYLQRELQGYGPHSVEILVSHPHADHYDLIAPLFANRESVVGDVLVSGDAADYEFARFPAFAARHQAAVKLGATQATRLKPCGAATPIVLVADMSGSPNRRSAVLWLSYDEFLLLSPGDAEGDTEAQALRNMAKAGLDPGKKPLAATLLIASHHGAVTAGSNSERWIEKAQPRFVLVSAGDPQSEGHPNCAVVDRFLAAVAKESPNHRVACPWSEAEASHAIDTTANVFSTHDCGDLVVTYTPAPRRRFAVKFDAKCEVPVGGPAILPLPAS
jgi:beta-lactamase superfamily II metal-dependent hydrolase